MAPYSWSKPSNELASQHSSSDGGDALRVVEIEGRDLSLDTRWVCEVVFWSTWTHSTMAKEVTGCMDGWMIIWMKVHMDG